MDRLTLFNKKSTRRWPPSLAAFFTFFNTRQPYTPPLSRPTIPLKSLSSSATTPLQGPNHSQICNRCDPDIATIFDGLLHLLGPKGNPTLSAFSYHNIPKISFSIPNDSSKDGSPPSPSSTISLQGPNHSRRCN